MKYLLAFICLALITSCTHPNQITRIEFARSGAWSDWGAAISIDNSLQYNYYGGKENHRYYYTGKITQQLWDTLITKLNKIDLKNTWSDDGERASDVPYYELIVYWQTDKKRFVRNGIIISDSLSRVAGWIDNSNESVKLKQVSKPIKFETTFQNPPAVDIKQVKFPPPEKK